MEQEHRLHKGQRVRLKGDGQDSLYKNAQAGSEGWIEALGFDEVGFPMVKIHWDTKHWTYNGEKDTITFEDHFDPVEETTMPETPEDPNIVAWIAEQLGTTEEEVRGRYEEANAQKAPKAEEDPHKVYENSLMDAVADAEQAEAFIMLVVNADADGEKLSVNWDTYSGAHSPISALLSQQFLAQLAAESNGKLTEVLLNQILVAQAEQAEED